MTKNDVLSRLQTAFTTYHAALPGIFPKRKKITVTIPAGDTTYTVTDAWITTDVDCYAHDLATKGLTTSVSWEFNAETTGTVTFTIGTALSTALTFDFGMIKGGLG